MTGRREPPRPISPSERDDRRLDPAAAPGIPDSVTIARSWIARPVESNSVISSAEARPAAAPVRTAPSSVTCSRATTPRRDRAGELAAGARLLPLVAEEPAACHRLDLDLALAVGVGAERGQVLAGAKVGAEHHGLGSRRDGYHDVLGGGLRTIAGPPAELAGERLGRLGSAVEADARPVADRLQTASRPGAIDPAADDPDDLRRRAQPGPGPRPPRRRPVRSEVTEAASITASSSPVAASESRIAPRTTGRPCSLLPGNEVTHLSSASPSPRAGIARKSPRGGRVEVDLGRHLPIPPRVALECEPRPLDGRSRVDGRQHRIAGDDWDLAHVASH